MRWVEQKLNAVRGGMIGFLILVVLGTAISATIVYADSSSSREIPVYKASRAIRYQYGEIQKTFIEAGKRLSHYLMAVDLEVGEVTKELDEIERDCPSLSTEISDIRNQVGVLANKLKTFDESEEARTFVRRQARITESYYDASAVMSRFLGNSRDKIFVNQQLGLMINFLHSVIADGVDLEKIYTMREEVLATHFESIRNQLSELQKKR